MFNLKPSVLLPLPVLNERCHLCCGYVTCVIIPPDGTEFVRTSSCWMYLLVLERFCDKCRGGLLNLYMISLSMLRDIFRLMIHEK